MNVHDDATNNGMCNFIPRNSSGGNVNRFQGGTSTYGVWQHIVVTFNGSLNGGTTTMYQDGALMTNIILGTNPLPNSTASSYANQLVLGRAGSIYNKLFQRLNRPSKNILFSISRGRC